MNKDEEFFYDNAGYSVPPGREECARRLASAEAVARHRCWRVEWMPEQDIDLSWCENCEAEGHEHEVECAVLLGGNGTTVLASLGNIVDATPQYRRVIAAELALQALQDG